MSLTSLFNYIGLLIGIFGILLSIYLFIKGREAKEPRCYYSTRRNISKLSEHNDSKIKLFYGETEVTRVFTTQIWFWNNGKKPITKSDIQSKSGLILSLSDNNFDIKILDYEVVKLSRPEINFTAEAVSDMSLSIDFDFLDKNDGALIEIQHTGSNETLLAAQCVILGAPEGLNPINSKRKTFFIRILLKFDELILGAIKKPIGAIMIFTVFAFLLIGISTIDYYKKTHNSTITISAENLNNLLKSKLPIGNEENIKTIMVSANTKSEKTSQIITLFNYSITILLLLFLSFMLWKINVVPYPKNIKPVD